LRADPARGGAEKYTFDLAKALAERNHQVSMVAATHSAAIPGVRQVSPPSLPRTKIGIYKSLLETLENHTREQRYDVVHAMLPVRRCDLYHPHAGLAVESLASGHLKHPGALQRVFGLLFNQLNARRRLFASVERQMVRECDDMAIVCLSDYIRESVRRHYPLPEARLPLLFNAVDIWQLDPQRLPSAGASKRAELGIRPDQLMALMVAQDFSRKGLRQAIQAMARMPRSQFVLVVVGKDDPAPYRREIHEAGLGSEVIFAGTAADTYPFYQAADFLILPTWHDPCSLVVLEALAMGVPVISTRRNGACEIMKEGVHGFVIDDPANIEALRDTMLKMQPIENRRLMSRACLDLRPSLSYASHIDSLVEIYYRLQKSQPPATVLRDESQGE
jgi:UDP-glucose:(heptosyl)LPS alpha-1,3-glucosyltransferase